MWSRALRLWVAQRLVIPKHGAGWAAAVELLQSFWPMRRHGTGARDFLYVFLLLLLLSVSVLFVVASHDGLIKGMSRALLGYVEGGGSPIRTYASADIGGSFPEHTFDDDGLTNRGGGSFDLHVMPVKQLYDGDVILSLPDEPRSDELPNDLFAWKRTTDNELTGWAVSVDDPLWRRLMPDPGNDLRLSDLSPGIVFDGTAARESFDLDAYRQILKRRLPPFLLDEEPAFSVNDVIKLPHLWLQTGRYRRLERFDVHWRDGLPLVDDVTFVVSMSTYSALTFDMYRNLPINIEQSSEGGEYITSVHWQANNAAIDDVQATVGFYVQCMGGGIHEDATGLTVRFDASYRVNVVDHSGCVDRALKDSGISATVNSHGILTAEKLPYQPVLRDVSGSLQFLCVDANGNASEAALRSDFLNGECQNGGDEPVEISTRFDVPVALVYLPETLTSDIGINKIRNARIAGDDRIAFHIAGPYIAALERLGFLQKTLAFIVPILGIFGGIFTLFAFVLKVNTTLGHRRRNYALMLSLGLKPSSIRRTIVSQIVAVTILAYVAAYSLFHVSSRVLNQFFDISTAGIAGAQLGLVDFEIFPQPDLMTIAVVGGAMLVTIALMVNVLVYFLPMRQRTTAMDIIS